jgi:hypothetical protein
MNNNEVHHNLYKVRMAVIASGFFLLVGGIVMIFMDLKSEGAISVKSPFFSGSINATYIGLLVIFLGVTLEVVAVMKGFNNKEKVEITTQVEKVAPQPQPQRLDAQEIPKAGGELKKPLPAALNPPKKEAPLEQQLRDAIEKTLNIKLPAEASLDDPEVKRLIDEKFKSLGMATSNYEVPTFNRETYSYRSETSGARLASNR